MSEAWPSRAIWGTGVARALTSLGYVAVAQDSLEAARALLEESLSLSREIGDPDGVANALAGFGDVACAARDWPAAHSAYAESLTARQGLGDERQVAGALQRMGILAVHQGHPARGARLLGASQALRGTVSNRMSPLAQAEWDAALSSLRAALPPDDLDAAFAEGRALSRDAAVALALTPPATAPRKKKGA